MLNVGKKVLTGRFNLGKTMEIFDKVILRRPLLAFQGLKPPDSQSINQPFTSKSFTKTTTFSQTMEPFDNDKEANFHKN